MPLNARLYDISVLDNVKLSPAYAALDVQLSGSSNSPLTTHHEVPKSHIAQLERSNDFNVKKNSVIRQKPEELSKKLGKSAKDHVNGKKKVLTVKPRAAQQGHVNVHRVNKTAVIRKKAKKLVKDSRKLASNDNINGERKVHVGKIRTNKQDRINVRPPKKATVTSEKPKKLTKKKRSRKLKKRGRNSKRRISLIKVFF